MSCKLVVSLLLLSLFAVASARNGWCNINSCRMYGKGEHTLCAYPYERPAQACFAGGDLGGTLSPKDQQNIVDLHNEMRQTVASGAETRGWDGPQPRAQSGKMPNLQWDDTLAAIAQKWADQCDFRHDSCRDVPDYQVGQNIGYSGTTGDLSTIDILSMVHDWYNEVRYFNSNEVKKFSGQPNGGQVVGHYTQIVWADTTKIGCGLRSYYEGEYYRRYLVCNYGPAGNFPGQPIYQT